MIEVDFTIGGQPLPIFAFDVTGGAHGSTGSAAINTSIKMLKQSGISLPSMAINASQPLPVTLSTTDDKHGNTQIFNGTYTVGKWSYVEDVVILQCRDKSGKSMVDEKRVNVQGSDTGNIGPGEASSGAPGVNTQNNKLSGFVTQIATTMGLTPMLNLQDDPLIGTVFGDTTDTIQLSTPKTFWAFLTRLARDTGNIMYTTPQGQLYFGSEGQGQSLALSWGVPNAEHPFLSLEIEHNPARNASHKVSVHSYDPTSGKVTTGTKTKRSGVAKYAFHVDGLTAQQAQKRAEATSKDISRHEVMVSGEIDYYPLVKPGQPATLTGNVDPTFAGYPFYVNVFNHAFRMAKGKTSGDLFTHLTLLKQGDK